MNIERLHRFAVRLFVFSLLISAVISGCSKEKDSGKPVIFLKTGVAYTPDKSSIPVGGAVKIGVIASGSGVPLTYIRIDKITSSGTFIQVDRGIYQADSGFDQDFVFSKDTSHYELYRVTVMNSNRDTASATLTIFRGAGYAYGEISHHTSIIIGLQSNPNISPYLDLDYGIAYNESNLSGHEQEIDLLGYYYITSGLSSPTFTCPGYTAAIGYYPGLGSWPARNTTLYDYNSTDNDLISIEQFDSAANDSLLVSAYKPDKVSGNCKYCYTGKVIPFKTQQGKYGLIKIIRADEVETGSIEMEIKIQK